MRKLNIIISWIKNTRLLFSFRKFFFYYLQKIVGLNSLPRDKKYLKNFPDFIGGYCSTNFLSYAPVYMEPYIKMIAQKIFDDESSRKLYRIVFLRHMYSAHLISGWEEYYDGEEKFTTLLKKIKSDIKSEVKFGGNGFIVKNAKTAEQYKIHYKNGKSYILPVNWFEVSVFSFKLGLVFLEDKYLSYIKDSYLIDAGAFVGDSSIVLAEYTDKKILAIEPEENNFKLLNKTIELNKLQNKIDAFKDALDKESRKVGIYNGGPGSIIENQPENSIITTTTLDNLVGNKYQKIGLIKMDVEGYEMNILLGSKIIIERDRPILLVSIYHSGDQFINIPLYLKEKYADIYNFKLIDCNPAHPLAEKVLLCLPKDI